MLIFLRVTEIGRPPPLPRNSARAVLRETSWAPCRAVTHGQGQTKVQVELRRVLDEFRRCSAGGASWGGTDAALHRLRNAIDAAPVEQVAFPSGALDQLAELANRHEPGSAAASTCLSAVLQLVRVNLRTAQYARQ